jgi:N-methylhydantoinase A
VDDESGLLGRAPRMTTRIGIDTGGTFTDFVLFDDDAGTFRVIKVPSTPDDPSRAIQAGLRQLAGADRARQVVVGTTVATNAVIERRGPQVVFVTNAGFEDVPFIARIDKERLYDLHWEKPSPLVRRRDCVGVGGRLDHHGAVLEPLAEDDLAALVERLEHVDGDSVVAVSYLFAYLNPEHELRTASALKQRLPGATVSVSHEVSPVWREYERASTTIADAFVKPVIERYVDAVGAVVEADTGLERWNLLASNGGYLRADQARRRPAQLLLSGLAGGVIGARFFAEAAGFSSVFSLDMGGTSCDFGLVLDGAEQYAAEFDVAWGIPVTMPCVAVSTIGAGGGSIAWVDRGGLLHVGPRSAGAQPGPVAYRQGGTEPTLTDANLTLGRLDAAYFLGGTMPLDLDAARAAYAALGGELGLAPEAAAEAAVRTADENMANAIRLIAVERGLDPRDFALIGFGGAGPLHARAVAERLDMPTMLIPPHPGLCSALGAAIAQARVDRVQTMYARSDSVDLGALAGAEAGLREVAVAELRRNVDVQAPIVRRSADLRYAGQNYELEVELPEGDLDVGWTALLERFAADHERQYGFSLPGEAVELINLRVTAMRANLPVPLVADPHEDFEPERRDVWFEPDAPVDCPIHRRVSLRPGTELEGPAVIEEPDSTTLVFPGDRLLVGESGVLVLTLGAGS